MRGGWRSRGRRGALGGNGSIDLLCKRANAGCQRVHGDEGSRVVPVGGGGVPWLHRNRRITAAVMAGSGEEILRPTSVSGREKGGKWRVARGLFVGMEGSRMRQRIKGGEDLASRGHARD
jgi:hypothetical protein